MLVKCFLTFMLAGMLISGCNNKDCSSMPASFEARIVDERNNNITPDAGMRVYYYRGTSQQELQVTYNPSWKTFLLPELTTIVLKDKINTYYIESNNDRDTLHVRVEGSGGCMPYFFQDVTFNNKEAVLFNAAYTIYELRK